MVSCITEMKIEIIVRWQVEETGAVEEPGIVVKGCGHCQIWLLLLLLLLLLLAHKLG